MSWVKLKEMLDENRRGGAEERRNPPMVCPYDGSLLDYSPKRGLWNCPMGDYQTRGRAPE